MKELPIVSIPVTDGEGDLRVINYVQEVDGSLSRVTYLKESVLFTVDPFNLRGLAANRPPAFEVEIGTTYWSVDADEFTVDVSDGENWRPV